MSGLAQCAVAKSDAKKQELISWVAQLRGSLTSTPTTADSPLNSNLLR